MGKIGEQNGIYSFGRVSNLGEGKTLNWNELGCCLGEFWCTILLLLAHPECVKGSTQAFTTINKSSVYVVQWLTSLSELLGLHMSRSTGESYIYIYIYIYTFQIINCSSYSVLGEHRCIYLKKRKLTNRWIQIYCCLPSSQEHVTCKIYHRNIKAYIVNPSSTDIYKGH